MHTSVGVDCGLWIAIHRLRLLLYIRGPVRGPYVHTCNPPAAVIYIYIYIFIYFLGLHFKSALTALLIVPFCSNPWSHEEPLSTLPTCGTLPSIFNARKVQHPLPSVYTRTSAIH
ncbi:unnamed protein product [Ectocarpus sp. 4 AP-2014]